MKVNITWGQLKKYLESKGLKDSTFINIFDIENIYNVEDIEVSINKFDGETEIAYIEG